MQQPITRREVYEPSLTATVGGRDVELESASMDRALPDPLGRESLRAASGHLVALEGPDVTETVATPWDPGTQWPPVPETSASVEMDTGSGPVSLLGNGRVMSADGGTSGREVDVEVADQYQSLDRTISWGPVGASMPAHESAGWDWDRMRYVGMNSVAVTDMILRHCGWYATPPRLQGSALSVPALGTMWPDWGDVLDAIRRSDRAGFPYWQNTPWGIGVTDFEGEYQVAGSMILRDKGRVEMTALTTAPSDYSRMEITAVAGAGLARLTWTSSQVRIDVRGTDGAYATAVSLPRVDGLVYATIRYVSDTSVHCIVRCGGQSASATVPVSNSVTTNAMKNVRIVSTGGSGGFQVAFPWVEGSLEGWVPNAQIRPRGANRNHLDVLPSVEGGNCADLLAEQCEAEAATYWIDETGVLQWWDLGRLESGSSVATLTSDDDIAEAGFTWSHSLSSVKSRTVVKWREPAREWHPEYAVTLWQGPGKTLNSGDANVEEWINTPNDEVWIMPDLNMRRAGSEGTTDFNYGAGSWYGGVVADRDLWAYGTYGFGDLLASVEKVTARALKLSASWTGTEPATMRTPSTDATTSLWRIRRDFDLPIIRGKGKYTFTDRLTYSTQTGPTSAPEHEVDAGWWIQTADQAEHTANYYGARLTVPQPVLSSVALIPVPGLQLGDMVTVVDGSVSRLTVRGIVVSDSRSVDAGMSVSHSVAIRPVAVTRNGVTWAEWATVARPQNWKQWATSEGGTWKQWGSNPLNA